MKKILLVVHTKTFFPRMFELGRSVAASGCFKPVFHFAFKTGWLRIDEDIHLLEQNGFQISAETRDFVKHKASVAGFSSIGQGKKNVARVAKEWLHVLPLPVRRMLSGVRTFLCRENLVVQVVRIMWRLLEIGRIIKQEGVSVVVLSVDVPTWDTGVFIKAARQQGMPTLVAFSQTGPLDEASHAYSQLAHLSLRWPWNYCLGKVYPKWVCERDGKKFLMMGFGSTLAKEVLGVSMPQPWIESSSYADVVLIESEAYLERGIQAGLKAENLLVTGLPFHDVLYSTQQCVEENSRRINSLHGFKQDKPIIVTSLLPKYSGRDNAGPEFRDYEDMVAFWIKTLTGYSEYNTILSLHPSQDYDYSYVEQWGVKIAKVPITEIIPLCHIFVTSLSSTITMAIACGKPVINYDFAGYENTHYDAASGVFKIRKRQEFRDVLERLLKDEGCYQETVRLQQSQAKHWGNIDGHAGERIIRLMEKLTDNNRV
jgi:hypothetical protein